MQKMKFIVIDKRNGKDITKDYDWVLLPNGELKYLEYSDLIGLTYAEAIVVPDGMKEVVRLVDGKWKHYPIQEGVNE